MPVHQIVCIHMISAENNEISTIRSTMTTPIRSLSPNLLRRTNTERALINKKRVVKMLCAVVLEFFICWTPLYIINTVSIVVIPIY